MCPDLIDLVKGFLYENTTNQSVLDAIPSELPKIEADVVKVFHSAAVTFYSPSDETGIRGVSREYVRCTPKWRGLGPRRDCLLINVDERYRGFAKGMDVGRVRLFFSFEHEGTVYPCALLEWFKKDGYDLLTRMWKVVPEIEGNRRKMSVVHLGTVIRAAHLSPDFGRSERRFPARFDFRKALECFRAYYVNKYIDGHTHELMLVE
jgi:hypothetical protein